jgi:hypothetical protein
MMFRHCRESEWAALFVFPACVASLLPQLFRHIRVGHSSSNALAGHLGHSRLRKQFLRGMVTIPVTMRGLALGLQAALFINSRLFIPMLHILLLRKHCE